MSLVRAARDLLDLLVPYYAAGLEDHEYCLVVTSEPLPWQAFLHRMSQHSPGFMGHVQQGNIAIVSYTTWYLTEGTFDPRALTQKSAATLAHALQQGDTGVRLSGDGSWIDQHTWSAFLAYERDLDDARIAQPLRTANETAGEVEQSCTRPKGRVGIGGPSRRLSQVRA